MIIQLDLLARPFIIYILAALQYLPLDTLGGFLENSDSSTNFRG